MGTSPLAATGRFTAGSKSGGAATVGGQNSRKDARNKNSQKITKDTKTDTSKERKRSEQGSETKRFRDAEMAESRASLFSPILPVKDSVFASFVIFC
jgi:hypothetical protein